jgi:hypothetical protein
MQSTNSGVKREQGATSEQPRPKDNVGQKRSRCVAFNNEEDKEVGEQQAKATSKQVPRSKTR